MLYIHEPNLKQYFKKVFNILPFFSLSLASLNNKLPLNPSLKVKVVNNRLDKQTSKKKRQIFIISSYTLYVVAKEAYNERWLRALANK